MSTIEERLSRDIDAVTGGIVVTESDLREAREVLDGRVEGRRHRNRRRGVVAAAAAAALVVGVTTWQGLRSDDARPMPAEPVPAPSELAAVDEEFLTGDVPTPERLEGVWRLDNPSDSRTLVRFTADGGFALDDAGRLSEDPLVRGTYETADGVISVEVDGGVAQCAGQSLSFRVAVNEGGGLNVVPVDASPNSCGRPVRHQWVLEQQLPTPASVTLNAPLGASWDPPVSVEALPGDWYVAGGGYLLELREEGSYSILAGHGEEVDRGAWTVDGPVRTLTMTSSTDSQTCREGDQLVQGDLRARDMGTLVVRGTVERDDCAIGFAKKAWFRLAP